MAKKKNKFSLGFIVACVACLLAIIGFCMVFTQGFIYAENGGSMLGISVSGKVSYPGLGVVFGGTHNVVVTATTNITGSSTTTSSVEFAFNFVGCFAFVLALLGGVVGLFGSKNKYVALCAVVLALVGTVMVFFTVSGYVAANSTDTAKLDPNNYKWGAGLIIAIICFCVETLGLCYNAFKALKK